MSEQQVEFHPNITEDQKKWIAALDSGMYKQNTGALHKLEDNSFCCLGVACDVFKNDISVHTDEVNKYAIYDKEIASLPRVLVTKLQLKDQGGSSFVKNTPSLISWNDTYHSFEYISSLLKSGQYFENCQPGNNE